MSSSLDVVCNLLILHLCFQLLIRINLSGPIRLEANTAAAFPPGEIQVYEHGNYNDFGEEDGFTYRTTFDTPYCGDDMNDEISSIIIYSGNWTFYEHFNYNQNGAQPGYAVELGPGYYPDVSAVGIPNDSITSWRQTG